jgi:hypothetical protein
LKNEGVIEEMKKSFTEKSAAETILLKDIKNALKLELISN